MATLHLFFRSPADGDAWRRCLGRSGCGDALLLLGDAVYGACRQEAVAGWLHESGATVYALEPDLKARGIEVGKLVSGVQWVGFSGFVELTVTYERIVSW